MRNNDAPHDGESRAWWTRLRPVRAGLAGLVDGRSRRAAVAGVVCCLGLVTVAQVRAEQGPAVTVDAAAVDERSAPPAAGRDMDRAAIPDPTPAGASPTTGAAGSAVPSAPASPKPSAKPTRRAPSTAAKRKAEPAPVAGLTVAQMNNAKIIVRTGQQLKMPRRALVIAVATAMQESRLLNLASGVIPESMDLPNQGVGWDHDSVGLFQQRPSSGWGPVHQLMRPAYAATQFYRALAQVPGWQQMALTDAAQAVQISGFPYAYAQHEGRAAQVVSAIVAV